jgi:ESAT-6 family protein
MFDDSGGGGGPGGNLAQVDPALLTAAAIDAGETAEGLDTLLRNLMDNLSPLLTEWQGVGGAAFQNVRDAFDVQMRDLNRALRSLGEDMGLSSRDYVNADEEMRDILIATGATDGQVGRLTDANTTEISQLVDAGASESEITRALNTY